MSCQRSTVCFSFIDKFHNHKYTMESQHYTFFSSFLKISFKKWNPSACDFLRTLNYNSSGWPVQAVPCVRQSFSEFLKTYLMDPECNGTLYIKSKNTIVLTEFPDRNSHVSLTTYTFPWKACWSGPQRVYKHGSLGLYPLSSFCPPLLCSSPSRRMKLSLNEKGVFSCSRTERAGHRCCC